MEEEIRKLEHMSKQLSIKVAKDLKNAKAELKASAFDETSSQNVMGTGAAQSGGGSNKVTPALQQMLLQKADKIYMDQLLEKKASKNDAEIALKKLDVIQKQLKQIIVLITEKLRTSLENQGGESRNNKTNRKVKLLHQALLIFKWIQDFEASPPQISGMFDFDGDIKMATVPPQLRHWEHQISADVSKLDMMKFSPNNNDINEKIKSQFNTVYG